MAILNSSQPSQPPDPPANEDKPVAPAKEQTPEAHQDALRKLIAMFEQDNRNARLEEVKRCQQNREYYRGNQNIYFDSRSKRWMPIATSASTLFPADLQNMSLSTYTFVDNHYRANMDILCAVLTQNPPGYRFAPQNPGDPQDQATAKAADDVADLINDNNDLERRELEKAFYFCTDGMAASYTYFDVSEEKYGTHDVPQKQPGLACPSCGYKEPAPEGADPNAMAEQAPPCPDCGAPMALTPIEAPPVTMPNGQERIIYVGGLETVKPFYANSLEECAYWGWEIEVPKAWVKSVYPDVALKGPEQGTGNEDQDETARQARIALRSSSYGRNTEDGFGSLVTFRRYWIRPWAFRTLDDDTLAQELTATYPDGAYVAFAGPAFCECKNERIEKRWAMRHARPGSGMIRDGIMQDYIDIQRQINLLENIKADTFDRGIPPTIHDENVFDDDAWKDAGSQPGNIISGRAPVGGKMADAFYTPDPLAVSPQLIQDLEEKKTNDSQMILGTFPSMFGANEAGNDTATGIQIAQNAALGRMSIYKGSLNGLYADTLINAIECFKENRTEDVQIAVEGGDGELDAAIIHLDQLKGHLYARTDANDAYPVSLAQQQAQLSQLQASPSPQIQGALNAPDNFDYIKTTANLRKLKMAGEDARQQQYREIKQMVASGQPLPVDVLMDDHQYHMGALKEWWASPDGQAAVAKNPAVAEAIRSHMNLHLQGSGIQTGMAQQAQQANAPAQPAPEQGQEPPAGQPVQ